MRVQMRRVSMNWIRIRRIVAVSLIAACGLAASSLALGAEKAGSAAVADKANGAEGEKALVIVVTVPAPVSEVWKAFTTSEGLSTWLTPNAVVDLREGGEWTAHFPGGSTGGGTIVSFIPEKEIILAALAPDKFPHV